MKIKKNHFTVLGIIIGILFCLSNAKAENIMDDTIRVQPKANYSMHCNSVAMVPTIFLNDAIKNADLLPSNIIPWQLLERAAFLQSNMSVLVSADGIT